MRRARSSEPATCAGLAYFLAAALFFSLRFILDVFLLTVSPSREVLTAVRFSSSVISSVIFSASKALLGAILDSAVKAFKLESCTSLGALKFWALISRLAKSLVLCNLARWGKRQVTARWGRPHSPRSPRSCAPSRHSHDLRLGLRCVRVGWSTYDWE